MRDPLQPIQDLPARVQRMLAEADFEPPAITYDGPPAQRDSRSLWSEVKSVVAAGGTVLDLGCGVRDQAVCAGHLGYRYLGLDYGGRHADVIGDAHALPFPDASFDCVFSYAVLEHLHSPAAALAEIERVLRPGGLYIGTVSQGEPFHDSYFHMTSWGLCALLAARSRLRLRRLWAGPDTLGALASMGRYPKVVKLLLGVLDRMVASAPWLAPRKACWPMRERQLDALHRAGGICFSVMKESRDAA